MMFIVRIKKHPPRVYATEKVGSEITNLDKHSDPSMTFQIFLALFLVLAILRA